MKVLVFGATGFIGKPVCEALVRDGHQVYGLTRSSAKAKQLQADEITPIVAEQEDTSSFLPLVRTLDVVIDCVGGDADISKLCIDTFRAISKEAGSKRDSSRRLTYIWTSGTWIHGDDKWTQKSESDPLDHPPELTSWRPAVEKEITSSDKVSGLCIRPSLLYGRSGSIFAIPFGQALQSKGQKIVWKGQADSILATIHQDDLAEIFRLAAVKGHLAAGLIIDASAYNEPLHAILTRLASVAANTTKPIHDAVKYEEPESILEKAISTSSVLKPTLARSLLGWEGPHKASVVEGIKTYYDAFVASSSP